VKNSPHIILSLLVLVLAIPFSAAGDELSGNPSRYGYDLSSGAVSINPLTIYIFCEATETLVVHPDYQEEAQAELAAEAISADEWLIEGRLVVKPQIARNAIATSTNDGDLALAGTLGVVSIDNVALADPAAVCTTKIKKHVCDTFDCTGCQGRNELSGGSLKYCKPTEDATDTCTLDGNSNACNIKSWSEDGCKGTIIATSTVWYNSCT
jgi:hypothetical protein